VDAAELGGPVERLDLAQGNSHDPEILSSRLQIISFPSAGVEDKLAPAQ
jgi:hypothetical protein